VPNKPLPATATGEVDSRSEGVIATLLPQVQPYARALVGKAAANGITIKVISGLRTYDEQNALYAQGRDKPDRIVTNARGGYSNHNFGVAFDVGLFKGNAYRDGRQNTKPLARLALSLVLNGAAIGNDPGRTAFPASSALGIRSERARPARRAARAERFEQRRSRMRARAIVFRRVRRKNVRL
jgi:hypothetical protein